VGFGPLVNIFGLPGEKVEKALFTRENPLQKSRHGVGLSPEESWSRGPKSLAEDGV
jgi:hypothetical protein